MGSIPQQPEYDVIVVGSGFGGVYLLHELRKRNFRTLVIDEGSDIGGVWYWNVYPGARTDSKAPLYALSDVAVSKDWTWSETYPAVDELQRYFKHIDATLDLSKDILFKTRVVGAQYVEDAKTWNVRTNNEKTLSSTYFVLATGFASKAYIPEFEGLDTFAGPKFHTSRWPQGGVHCAGKKVGVVGTGASGLQVIQEISQSVEGLTIFQHSPTYALPMGLRPLTESEQDQARYDALYQLRKQTFAGLDLEFNTQAANSVTPKERQAFFEELWKDGSVAFWLATYRDVIVDREINKEAYDFWRSKVLPRINDPKVAELLAPEKPPYFFGTKRATLEQRYWEVYNQENVLLVDAKKDPIVAVKHNGVETLSGKLHELDVLVLATGIDSVTGGILKIEIRGRDGRSLQDKWEKGTWTHLGLMTAGFPNLFFLYGPQGPTSFCNGPTCAEIQGSWVVQTLEYLRNKKLTEVEPTVESEAGWRALVNDIGNATLLPYTASEYMGTNVPGKPKEMLNYLGGVPDYNKKLTSTIARDYPGFLLA